MDYKDYYKIMGLPRTASPDEIKRAYRKLARKYHPDVSKEAGAEAHFKELNEAYTVLKDPKTRSQYDQFGEHWQEAGRSASRGRPHEGTRGAYASASGASGGVDPADFEDFINSVFGHRGAGRAYSAHAGHGQSPAYDQGKDVYAKLDISLEDSFQGTEKTLQLSVVPNKMRTIKVKIPKGITDKKQIRLKNQGGVGSDQQAGDLYIEISIHPHPLYNLKENNIYLTLPISPWEAVLGATVTVPTLAGEVNLKIPPHAQAGDKLRLKGRGLPTSPPGDQYVNLEIVIPDAENEESTKLYEQLAKISSFDPRKKLRGKHA